MPAYNKKHLLGALWKKKIIQRPDIPGLGLNTFIGSEGVLRWWNDNTLSFSIINTFQKHKNTLNRTFIKSIDDQPKSLDP